MRRLLLVLLWAGCAWADAPVSAAACVWTSVTNTSGPVALETVNLGATGTLENGAGLIAANGFVHGNQNSGCISVNDTMADLSTVIFTVTLQYSLLADFYTTLNVRDLYVKWSYANGTCAYSRPSAGHTDPGSGVGSASVSAPTAQVIRWHGSGLSTSAAAILTDMAPLTPPAVGDSRCGYAAGEGNAGIVDHWLGGWDPAFDTCY